MIGGFTKCTMSSRGMWQKYKDVNVKGLDNLDAINDNNIRNWTKITGTTQMPKMVQLIWNEIQGSYSDNTRIKRNNKKITHSANPEFIPEEFIIFYSCDFLRPKKSNNYSRKDLLCKKYGLYGWSSENKTIRGLGGVSDKNKQEIDYLNNLSCKDPCKPYKKCYGYDCCNVYNKWVDDNELVYCKKCKGLKTAVIAFNLFEIMRQILVAKCAIGKKNLLPYLLNPVTQQPFSEDELNNFSSMFTTSISKWKQNTNINKSFLRKNVQRITSYVTPALLVTSLLLVPGGQAAAIIALMTSIVWTVGYVENIENIWELEKISGNFKKGNKEYILASSKVALASAEAMVFSLVNIGFAKEGYSRFKAFGNSKMSGPMLKNQLTSGISTDLLHFMNKVKLFDYGLPFIGNVVTGETLHGNVRKLAYSGFGGLIYNMNKLKAIQNGKLSPNSFDSFDHKLNSLIIMEQELRAKQLPINNNFLNDSDTNPFIQKFCNVLNKTVDSFKKNAKIKKINRTLKKKNDELTPFQRMGKNILLDVKQKRKRTATAAAAGGGENLYNKIINPLTGRKVSIYGKIGKQILRNYMNF